VERHESEFKLITSFSVTAEGSESKEKQKSSCYMALYKTVIAWEDMSECDVKNCVLIGL